MPNQDWRPNENQNMKIFEQKTVELCLAIYRLTKLFPEDEVLKNILRRASIEIIILLAAGKIRDTILKVEQIKIYLSVAKEQNWAKPINFDLLINAYGLMAGDFLQRQTESAGLPKKAIGTPLPKEKKKSGQKPFLNGSQKRQQAIIELLTANKEVRVPYLKDFFKNVSERTLRNDLTYLIGQNLVKKVGGRKDARYFFIE